MTKDKQHLLELIERLLSPARHSFGQDRRDAAEAIQSLLVENERAFREGYHFGFVASSLLNIDEDWETYKARTLLGDS